MAVNDHEAFDTGLGMGLICNFAIPRGPTIGAWLCHRDPTT